MLYYNSNKIIVRQIVITVQKVYTNIKVTKSKVDCTSSMEEGVMREKWFFYTTLCNCNYVQETFFYDTTNLHYKSAKVFFSLSLFSLAQATLQILHKK